uniref:Cell division coordinator CpoB n=1 Tax=Rhodopseudomonas palustris (strain BisA53) TaxID=316055 RepID=Q07HG4_RHOP5
MSFRYPNLLGATVLTAALALSQQSFAQSDFDVDPEVRVQQLEQQLRTLTGQNEELQFRNRRLEEQLKALQAGAPASGAPLAANPAPNYPAANYPAQAAAPPVQPAPQAGPVNRPQYDQQPATIVQEPAAPAASGRRRGDAFDPNQNPSAPGAPRALGGGQLPMPADAAGNPIGRSPGEPLDLANSPRGGGVAPPNSAAAGLAPPTAPPSQTPKDEFDLGIGYMQRKDYALAEQTMRGFTQKYPSDRLVGDAQYWLGESFFQRQQYRDSAEAFLAVTTKYETSAKAADALLRLGQSLAALKEKEAACAAFGEVARKYPRASAGVKQAVDREQKRVKC